MVSPEFRGQIAELLAPGRAPNEEFYGEVRPLLTPEQVAKLDKYRARAKRIRDRAGL